MQAHISDLDLTPNFGSRGASSSADLSVQAGEAADGDPAYNIPLLLLNQVEGEASDTDPRLRHELLVGSRRRPPMR